MRSRGGSLRLLLGWVLVVVVTAAVTSLVVTRVGQDVAGELLQPLPVVTGTLPSPSPTPGTPDALGTDPSDPSAPAEPAASPSTTDAPDADDPSPASGSGGAAGRPDTGSDDAGSGAPGGARAGQPGTGAAGDGSPPVATAAPARPGTGESGADGSSTDGSGTGATPERPAPTGTAGGSAPGSAGPTAGNGLTRTATFSVPGGSVLARCRGQVVSARSVTPAYGYRFEVEQEGASLEVTFANDSREDHLAVRCVGGTPMHTAGDG